MNFTDDRFVTLFVIVYGLWWLVRRHQSRALGLLIVASLVFYGYHVWQWIPLLLACCAGDWAIGWWIAQARRPKLALGLGLTFNLLLLALWKYTPLVLRTIAPISPALDSPGTRALVADWAIPFGISFYTFAGMAYLIDVYRGHVPAEPNLWRLTLHLSFFPHLVAGPILRPGEFLNDLQPDCLPDRPDAPREAMGLIARGFFKKLVLADRIALAVDPFFAHVGDVTTEGVWSLPYVYLYALQIYLDFSAYTDIARGLGLLFGYRWPENFARPYLAGSIQDFWRRWHMTLSRFLRDYLYIPLGGDRHGRFRTAANIMVTMLLGGMWHGASWSFLLWGALHGAYLIVHRAWSCSIPGRRLAGDPGLVGRLWHACAIILTFHAVCVAWCFFRVTHLTDSLACVQKLFVFDAGSMLVGGACDSSLWLLLVAYGLLLVVREGSLRWIAGSVPSRRPILGSFVRGVQWGSISTLFALAFVLSQGGGSRPFIYFQF